MLLKTQILVISGALVSVKMVKAQGLSLSPAKLAGQCGRLKCCLRYELSHAASQVPRDEAYPGSAGEFPAGPACAGCGSGCCR